MNLTELRHMISEIISEEVGDFKYDDKFYPPFDKGSSWNFDKVRNMLSKLKSIEGDSAKRAEHVKELSADAGAVQRWCEKTLASKKDSGLRTKENFRKAGGGSKEVGVGMGSMSVTNMATPTIRRNF